MEPTECDIAAFVQRVRQCVIQGRVLVRRYASERAFLELGWEDQDIRLQLIELQPHEYHRCERSRHRFGEVIWVFTPEIEEGRLWIRLVERAGIVVVSFHPG